MLEGFSYWLQPEYLFAINIFFPRSSCSPTIPSHKKLMQQLWRSLPPCTVWDFFNPANAQKVATHHPVPKFQYWDAVPRQEYCKILVDHVKAALETRTTFAGVLCSSSLGTEAGTIQFLDRPFPGSDTHLLQTIKLFAQFLPSFIRCGIAFAVCPDNYKFSVEGLRCFVQPPMWKMPWTGG